MIIVLKPEASEREIDHVLDRLRELGLKSHISTGEERTIIGVIGDDRILQNQPLTAFPGVENVSPILAPWKLVSREFKRDNTVIDIGGVKIGGKKLVDHGRSLRGRENRSDGRHRPRRQGQPARAFFVAEPTSLAPLPIRSKASETKVWTFFWKRSDRRDFRSSAKFWIRGTSNCSFRNGHYSDRRPQHAEFRTAERGWRVR